MLAGHRTMPGSDGKPPLPARRERGLGVRARRSYRGERLRGRGHRHLDIGSQTLQLVHEPLITAIQVMQRGNLGLAGGDQPSQDHTGPGPDIETTHGTPGQ